MLAHSQPGPGQRTGSPAVLEAGLQQLQGQLTQWYQHLHAHPEGSTQEAATAGYLRQQLVAMGYELVDSLGYHSFAAVLRNGSGPVVWYRTDMDGLPLKEETGLPWASTNAYMHACGHDLHMSSWLGTARMLSSMRKHWSGTVVLLAQSAEETGQGARKLVTTEGYRRLPPPVIQLAFHDHATLEAGQVGFCDGYAMAAVDMLNIRIRGRGGHGASPDQAIDPVLLASQYVVALQSIVSRNLPPLERAVVTVGAINGGTVGNIIPAEVTLKLTIRSFSGSSRQRILDRLKEMGDHLARAAGLPEELLPVYELLDMSIPPVYNDPELGARLRRVLESRLRAGVTTQVPPTMIGEDFGVYGHQEPHVPAYLMWIGTVSPSRKEAAAAGGEALPSLHSARFAPDHELALPGAVRAMTTVLLELLAKKK